MEEHCLCVHVAHPHLRDFVAVGFRQQFASNRQDSNNVLLAKAKAHRPSSVGIRPTIHRRRKREVVETVRNCAEARYKHILTELDVVGGGWGWQNTRLLLHRNMRHDREVWLRGVWLERLHRYRGKIGWQEEAGGLAQGRHQVGIGDLPILEDEVGGNCQEGDCREPSKRVQPIANFSDQCEALRRCDLANYRSPKSPQQYERHTRKDDCSNQPCWHLLVFNDFSCCHCHPH